MCRQPDLGWSLRSRLEAQDCLLQPEMLALEVDRPIAGPEQANDADRFFQPADRPVKRNPIGQEVERLTGTQPADDPAGRQVVEGEEGLRQFHRMASQRLGHRRAELHPTGRAGGGGDRDQGIEEDIGIRLEGGQGRDVGGPQALRKPAHVVIGPP